MRLPLPVCALITALACAAAPASAAARPGAARAQAPDPQRPSTEPDAPGAPAPSELWSTVNVCNPAEHPGDVGVRVSAPPRHRLTRWVRVRIQYFNAQDLAWRVIPDGGDAGWNRLGGGRRTLQTGWTFTFRPPSPGHRIVMRGLVDVSWRRGRRPVRRERLLTEAGHADPADPQLADSRASCEIVA
jgi:hypothetical protein